MGSWEVDQSTGFLTNFRGTVTDSYAGTDPRYNNGETTLAQWEVSIDEVHQDGYDGEVPETLTISFPMGDGWFTEDGVTVEHPKGKERFHVSSIYGKIVASVTGDVENYGANAERTDGTDLEVDLTGLMSVLEERGYPDDLSIWKDLTFDFAEVLFDYGPDKKNEGQRIQTRRTMPVAVVGDEAEAKPAKPAAKKAPAKKAAAAKKGAAKPAEAEAKPSAEDRVAAAKAKAAAKRQAEASSGGDNPFTELTDLPELAERLNAVLAEALDFDSFVQAVVEIPEVEADDELLAKVIDEDAGPWASKVGG